MDFPSLTPAQQQALLNGPALAPPPGVVPQLDNPPNSRGAAIAIQIVCIVLATLACVVRMYTKIRITRQVVAADYSILLGWAVFVGYFVPSWLLSSVAAAVHQWNLRLRYLKPFLKYVHVGSIMYGICIFFVKLSILLQYIQIFVPAKKTGYMWWSCWALIVANFVFYFVSSFVEIWACHPVAKAWNPFITTGWCINVYVLNIAASSINTLSDIIILILPQVTIWRLHMSKQRRLGASAVFFIGVFACASAAVRLAYVVKLYSSDDLTYYTWYAGVWTYPEMTSGIIVACSPVALKFFQRLRSSRVVSQFKDSMRSLMGRATSTSATRDGEDRSRRNNDLDWPSLTPNPGRAKGMWSRIFADLDSTGKSQPKSEHRERAGWQEGVYVMHSIDMNTSGAKESREGENTSTSTHFAGESV